MVNIYNPAFGRLRQEDYKFKASLELHSETPISKKQNKTNKQKKQCY
jgi:hypothetical protein